MNNIEHYQLFLEVKSWYRQYYGWDLSHMKLFISPIPYYNNGYPDLTMKIEEFGGCWTNNSIVYINSDLELVMRHYKVKLS